MHNFTNEENAYLKNFFVSRESCDEKKHSSDELSGFAASVAWKMLGEPLNLGSTIVGVIFCGVALVCVSLATRRSHPSRQV